MYDWSFWYLLRMKLWVICDCESARLESDVIELVGRHLKGQTVMTSMMLAWKASVSVDTRLHSLLSIISNLGVVSILYVLITAFLEPWVDPSNSRTSVTVQWSCVGPVQVRPIDPFEAMSGYPGGGGGYPQQSVSQSGNAVFYRLNFTDKNGRKRSESWLWIAWNLSTMNFLDELRKQAKKKVHFKNAIVRKYMLS